MNTTSIPVQSLKSLLISTFSAISLAAIILVTVVWPAEYGLDPTGIGKAIGVTVLAPRQTAQAEVIYSEEEVLEEKSSVDVLPVLAEQTLPKTQELAPDPELVAVKLADTKAPETAQLKVPPVVSIPPEAKVKPKPKPVTIAKKTETKKKTQSPKPEKKPVAKKWQNTVVITVPADSGVEYKFSMKKGAKFGYTWVSNGAKLYYDFHGEPAGDKTGYFKSYQVKTASSSKGELIAPFAGIHGWYWENNTKSPVKVTLKTKGKYKIKGLL